MDTTEQETTEQEVALEEQEQEGTAAEEQAGAETPAEAQEDENEVVVTIGDEQPAAEEERTAPAWVKELRRSHRELQRQKKELETKLQAMTAETKPAEVGKKPRIEDFDYDAEKFEAALDAYFEQKRQADQEAERRQAEAKAQEDAWKATLATYATRKAEIRVKDFEEAEQEAQNTLSQTQQGIILQGAENPALVVYALGKNPKKAKELAAITDPVKYAFAVAKLEAQLKVTPRKPATEPEKVVTGSARVSGTVDSTLEHLREEAAKTGDYTKVTAYKLQKRNK